MKRIVATEKLQELNLPSESEFFAPLRSRNELVPLTFDLLDRRHLCADFKTWHYILRHFRDGEICVSRY